MTRSARPGTREHISSTSSISAATAHLSTKGGSVLALDGGNLLREDLSLPAAVIYQSRLLNNLHWMQRFADSRYVMLAPHGKTTMTPALFQLQLQAGAWGLTLATAPQVAAAYAAGVRRVLMANQLIGRRNMAIISELLSAETETAFEFFCLVDSAEQAHQLGRFFNTTGQSLQLLLEIGVAGGRCGCRSEEQIAAVCSAIAQYPSLKLAGIETYEGIIGGEHAVKLIREHLTRVRNLCVDLLQKEAFDTDQIILTGAGSAWYDLVAEIFADVPTQRILPVIRPGCYLIHDQGIYQDAQQKVMTRLEGESCDPGGDLESSLEIWAYVQSIPEPGRAILGLGKRDVAFDAGLPQPELHFRPGQSAPLKAPVEWRVVSIMDQHSAMEIPVNSDIRVGDIIALSTSHPCLTFDKWRQLCIIDDDFNVIERVNTYF